MTFSDWMADRKQVEVAADLGVHQSTVSRVIETGRASTKLAFAIDRLTDGAVAASSLNPTIAAVQARLLEQVAA